MTSQPIHDAFDALMGTFTRGGPIQFEDTVYEPQAGRPYLVATMSSYVREPVGIGADCVVQESGSYQVLVVRPSNEGSQAAGQMADLVCAHFPRGRYLATSSGQAIHIEIASRMPSMPMGDWKQIPVVIRWFASSP